MGQAMQKNERLIATLKEEMTKWTQPLPAREAAVAAELQRLPVERVGRPSLIQLTWAGMQPRYCHLNAVWMEENDLDRETRNLRLGVDSRRLSPAFGDQAAGSTHVRDAPSKRAAGLDRFYRRSEAGAVENRGWPVRVPSRWG